MAGEYDTVPLGEVASVRSGFAFKSSDWADHGIPVVKIANVKDGRLVMDGCSLVPQNVANSAAEFALQAGDILIAMTGYIGDVARVREGDLPAALNQRVGRFSIRDPLRLDQRFLFYLLRNVDVRKDIEGLGYGSAQPNVSPSLIHGVEVPLPPLPEQHAIAYMLGTLDDKIELNRRMNETLEAMARALFKSWFVDFDPVRAKAEGRDPGLPQPLADLFPDSFEDSELGEIPRGWRGGTLGDFLCQRVERCSASPDTAARPYVPIDCISPKSLFLTESKPGEEAQSSLTKFYKGDILFGAMRPYFHKVCIAPFDGTTRTTALVLYPRQGDDFAFGTLQLHHEATIDFATRHSTGSTIPYAVWTDSLDTMPVIAPPSDVRKAFNRLMQPVLLRIPEPYFESRSLAALRDALLPKLISGELRIKDSARRARRLAE